MKTAQSDSGVTENPKLSKTADIQGEFETGDTNQPPSDVERSFLFMLENYSSELHKL